mmetsp:Transcript_39671/g.71179  ORF Transcript_39671/g.71179 Transcript_39671/m.71179 type:complete len:239 (+) Transcript_39671:849-1565(+)
MRAQQGPLRVAHRGAAARLATDNSVDRVHRTSGGRGRGGEPADRHQRRRRRGRSCNQLAKGAQILQVGSEAGARTGAGQTVRVQVRVQVRGADGGGGVGAGAAGLGTRTAAVGGARRRAHLGRRPHDAARRLAARPLQGAGGGVADELPHAGPLLVHLAPPDRPRLFGPLPQAARHQQGQHGGGGRALPLPRRHAPQQQRRHGTHAGQGAALHHLRRRLHGLSFLEGPGAADGDDVVT